MVAVIFCLHIATCTDRATCKASFRQGHIRQSIDQHKAVPLAVTGLSTIFIFTYMQHIHAIPCYAMPCNATTPGEITATLPAQLLVSDTTMCLIQQFCTVPTAQNKLHCTCLAITNGKSMHRAQNPTTVLMCFMASPVPSCYMGSHHAQTLDTCCKCVHNSHTL